jgi:TonB-linked SusC/RagA family outer membrane protein
MKKSSIFYSKCFGRCALLILLMAVSTIAFAQNAMVTGTVTDASNEPVIGASIMLKGTSTGTTTDLDGHFKMNAAQGATLQVSYIGYKTEMVRVSGSNLKIVLHEDSKALDEVVVVGYGVQKKSVVTAAIAKVSSDDLKGTAPVRMDNALKGLAAGVTVTSSSGQPGAAARVRVRGVGTINNSDPLYIVDGMPIEGGLDYLNPNDIASIEVLKDAASGAVYGARAANGVILVTTKTGKLGKTKVTYDFSYGWQSAWRHRDVLNASEYAVMMNEGRVNAGMAPLFSDPYSYGEGTDWQNEVFNDNAPVINHQVSVSGANEKMNYLLSAGYYTQEGIVGGNFDRSNYQRMTLRSNTNYTVFDMSKDRNWLNSLKLNANISYARVKSKSIDANSQWGSPLGSALALSPILTVLEPDPAGQMALYSSNTFYTPTYDKKGNMYMIPGTSYNEMNNPVASLSLPGAQGWSHKVVANFSAELQLWQGLRFKTSYGADLSFWGSDSYTKKFYLSGNNHDSGATSVASSSSRGTVWQVENVLMYDKTIGKHSFSIILGQSAKQTRGYYLGGSSDNMIDPSGSKPYIDYTYGVTNPVTITTHTATLADGTVVNVYDGYKYNTTIYGGKNALATISSLFARLSYNYDERYMLQATVRRDGSSRFGANNHYATFPSFSLGWNVTNESFMKSRPEWLSNLKARFSWGKNGNENIGNFRYTVMTSSGNNYIFGSSTVAPGVKASGLANPDLKWEESVQTDFGLDFGFMSNSLTFTIDYYKKRTNGMLMEMNIPSYVGEAKPIGNVGKMDNSGVEMEANYKFNVGDVNIHIGGNVTYLKNKLIEYGNETGWANLDYFQGAGTISRAQNGKPFPYFYGYKTAGVFQNAAEVQAYKNADGGLIQPNAVAGDVRFVDVNGDGSITDADCTDIGNGMPDWSFGINFSAAWKGFDLSMMWQGTAGNDVYDATRRTDIASVNLPTWMLNRWTGEGTSTRIPRFALGDNTNWKSSDLYVYDGSYMRLKNIQLGYTLPEKLTKKAFISSLRFYVAAENLFTFTKYHGFDPEISSSATSLGIDYGVYPQARTWTVGVNLAF